MKYLLVLLVIPFLSASECGKKKNDTTTTEEKVEEGEMKNDSIPVCLQALIENGRKENPPTSPVQIDEYIYKGKTTYLLTAQCCDFFNELYDTGCMKICAPTGGFTGKGDGQCPDFEKEAKLVRTVWKEKNE